MRAVCDRGWGVVSDYSGRMSTSEPQPVVAPELTLAELIAAARPMGDLSRFVIEDLSEQDEDDFFAILADA